MKVDGDYWGRYSCQIISLFYNKTIKRRGLSPPETLDEFVAMQKN